MISKEEVRKLSQLARIEINEKETEELQERLSGVLEFVSVLRKADVSESATDKPAESGLKNVFRNDDNTQKPAQYTEAILAQAPEKENTHIKVKKII